jgi:hypothetical protein
VSAPPETPAGESQDVEMTDAPAVAKTPELVPSAAPENPPKPAKCLAPEPTPVVPPVEVPKQAASEPSPVPEASKAEPPKLESPKPTEPAAVPVETALAPHIPALEVGAATDSNNNTDNKVESAPEKPVDAPAQPTEVVATDPPATQPAEHADAAKKLEAAEDAGVKMLASSLESPLNGQSSEAAEPKQLEEPATQAESQAESQVESQTEKPAVTGEKRKADDSGEANGDTASKKIVVEDTPLAPTTNGSPPPRKAGRPKKDKKQPAPVGKTARRTRSQGAADI